MILKSNTFCGCLIFMYLLYSYLLFLYPDVHFPYPYIPFLYVQKSIKNALAAPEYVITDFAKFDRPGQLHVAFQAYHKYAAKKSQLPRPRNKVRRFSGVIFMATVKPISYYYYLLDDNNPYTAFKELMCYLKKVL